MITQLKTPFLETTEAAGAWAVEQFEYAGSLGLLFAQTVGGCFMRPLRARALLYELWKISVQSWFIVSVCGLFIGMVLAF